MQNTACSININGRAVNYGAPPGHTRELVGSRCLLVLCKHQQDETERMHTSEIPKATGFGGENTHEVFLSRESSTDLGKRCCLFVGHPK